MRIDRADIEAIVPYIESWPKDCVDTVGPNGERNAYDVIAQRRGLSSEEAMSQTCEWFWAERDKEGKCYNGGLMSTAMADPEGTAQWLRDWLRDH